MEGTTVQAKTEKIMIDFEYFIQLAIRKEMPWRTLALC